jgi:nucleoside-diphosphate-sugar epimerase
VIHLAALQVPFCAADPPRGALVNVVGTVNVFEAVKGTAAAEHPVVYSSSIAAYGADDDPMSSRPDPSGRPATHYGVYKFANEANARVFAADGGLASIALRPSVVYGVGRDQGVTSAPTAAMLAAARGEPYTISFSGPCQMHYAPDVARAFIAAARDAPDGAAVFNLGGPTVDVTDVVDAIRAVDAGAADKIEIAGDPLPFPAATPPDGFAERLSEARMTPLADGVAETIAQFRRLIDIGTLPARQVSSTAS